MGSYKSISLFLFVLIFASVAGCANNVKRESFRKSYGKIEIPKEWESLVSEKKAPQFILDYEIETMLFYDYNTIFTPAMKQNLSNIQVVLSDSNCVVLQDLLHAIANFYGHFKYDIGTVHEVRTKLFDDIKVKNLLTCKLLIMLCYIDNVELKHSIVKYVRENLDSFPVEYQIILKIFESVEDYRCGYSSVLHSYLRNWTDECTKRYFGLNPSMLPEDFKELDYNEDEMLTAVFDVKKFDWKRNFSIIGRIDCDFNYLYKDYFNAEEIEEFVSTSIGKINQCNEIYDRIDFQNVRFRYYKYINSLDFELPAMPKMPYVNYCSDKEEVDKTLNELKVSLAEWEEFAKSVLEDKNSN